MKADSDLADELLGFGKRARELADKYAKERKLYGEVKADISIIYASKMDVVNSWKRGASFENACVYLMSREGEYFEKMYKEMITRYNNYKAIERLLNAVEASGNYLQSAMKYNKQMDTYGRVKS